MSTSSNEWPASWQVLDQGLRVGRYTDPDFLKLEFDKLWDTVWQVAARVDEIPAKGDFTTYEIGNQSILLVRSDDDEQSIKAFFNFCPHRGTTLGDGCGHFEKERIVCPFHGWRWDLNGDVQLVLERNEFAGGNLKDEDVAMRRVHCVVYAGFVFINMAENPQPFDDFIAPIRHLLDGFVMKDMHHIWWKKAVMPANWKAAQEAFYEAYHVSATHPQLEKVGSEIVYGDRTEGEMFYQNLAFKPLGGGHGHFHGGDKTPIAGFVQEPVSTNTRIEQMAARMNLTSEGLGASILKEDIDLVLSLKSKDLADDANLGAEYVKAQYETAARQGRPMPNIELTPCWGGVIALFPNIIIIPQAGNAAIYRALPHPTDPNLCTFEIRSVKTLPEWAKPVRSTVYNVTDPDSELGLIPLQDLGNIPRVQVGMNSKGMKQIWLAENQECLIMEMHKALDGYLMS